MSEEEIKDRVERDIASGYSFDDIYREYGELLSQEEKAGTETGDTPGGFNALWNIRTETGIRVIRSERAKVRRELTKQREGELDRYLASIRGGGGSSRYG